MPPAKLSAARLNRVISRFCANVATEPLSFFSEADLQGMLYSKLVTEFPDSANTAYKRGPGSQGTYATGLVHREYGAGKNRRIDITLFDPEVIATIDNPHLKTGRKYLKPRFAVELGTEKTIDTAGHIERDLSKLSKATERGYLIHFFRDVTQADTGTKRRADTEEKLRRIFKRPVRSAQIPDNVVALFFLLRLAHSHKKIVGKCELFVPKTGNWEKVNLQRVRGEVLKRLASKQ